MKNAELFSFLGSIASPLFREFDTPWELLDGIREFILREGKRLPESEYRRYGRHIYVAKNAHIEPSARIIAPAIIGHGCEIRQGAYLRGAVILCRGCVVGNSTEIKGSLLLDGAAAPHYNYIGDSVVGAGAHLGAGATVSNLKSDKSEVTVSIGGEKIHTGRRKFGAAIGDGAEIGCGAVLMPGSIIGRGSIVYPLTRVRGAVPDMHIMKSEGNVVRRVL